MILTGGREPKAAHKNLGQEHGLHAGLLVLAAQKIVLALEKEASGLRAEVATMKEEVHE